MFRCHSCGKVFTEPNVYIEKHGLDTPPYEQVPICPHCSSSEFGKWEPNIEKSEVAEKLLTVIAALNRYIAGVEDLFGKSFSNYDLDTAYGAATEMIDEMYDEFISPTTTRNITKIRSNNEIKQVLAQITGV